jgi:hypothetical protein
MHGKHEKKTHTKNCKCWLIIREGKLYFIAEKFSKMTKFKHCRVDHHIIIHSKGAFEIFISIVIISIIPWISV